MSDSSLQNIGPAIFKDKPNLKEYKQATAAIQEYIFQQFEKKMPVSQLILKRSQLIDELLQRLCHNICENTSVALLAVGGYGRQELHPSSDIDILILLSEVDNPDTNERLEALLMNLWDIGLEVGHAVRTVDECVEQASNDLTIMTNLLESRFLFGDQTLFKALEEKLSVDHIWPSDKFFAAKKQELTTRYAKYDNSSGSLEPNIKESPGGMRDIQTIIWMTMRELGSSDLASLVDIGFLTDKEYEILHAGLEHLWEIRFALHMHTKKHEDRLLFDYQKTLATRFGYSNDDNNLAVEYFMQNYYRTATEVFRLTEMLLQLFEESYLQKHHPLEKKKISDKFITIGDFIEAANDDLFENKPSALLEVFLLLEQNPQIKGIRANTIRLIRENTHRINDDFRNNEKNKALFIAIMSQPEGVTHELRRMNRYGVLAAYLPEFQHIVGRMQYDLFHAYTVDEHTLFVVRNIRRLAVDTFSDEFPFASRLIKQLDKPELLNISGLFHDIGKGCGGDHSEIGANIVKQFGERHGLSDEDNKLVIWLVANHLNMSMTAQRKDIEDPEVIREFADLVGNINYLNNLYLLTLSDSRATNPKRWNSWRNSILIQLYQATRAMLEKDDATRSITALVGQRQQEAKAILTEQGFSDDTLNQFWATLSMDYFMRSTSEEIVTQTSIVLAANNNNLPIIEIFSDTERGGSEIFFYGKDIPNLFSKTTRVLDQLTLSIVGARLVTTDENYIINSYFVLEEDGSILDDAHRIEEIKHRLQQSIWSDDAKTPSSTNRILPRHLKHFTVKPSVHFENNTPQVGQTTLYIKTGDRPGLLADIAQKISDNNITVLNARISTVGERIEDIIILQNDKESILSHEQSTNLSSTLVEMLNASEPTS